MLLDELENVQILCSSKSEICSVLSVMDENSFTYMGKEEIIDLNKKHFVDLINEPSAQIFIREPMTYIGYLNERADELFRPDKYTPMTCKEFLNINSSNDESLCCDMSVLGV